MYIKEVNSINWIKMLKIRNGLNLNFFNKILFIIHKNKI